MVLPFIRGFSAALIRVEPVLFYIATAAFLSLGRKSLSIGVVLEPDIPKNQMRCRVRAVPRKSRSETTRRHEMALEKCRWFALCN
ncbi:hypothetical protein AGR1B_Lc50153 [Agrobacterium fabacearum S56]|nr:hypothetical protein AGR1B_Lc50153 [Agrobacterium fabacearum S56]